MSMHYFSRVSWLRVPIKTELEATDPKTVSCRDQVLIGVLNVVSAVIGIVSLFAGTSNASEPLKPHAVETQGGGSLQWFDAKQIGLEGRGWTETLSDYDRLPAKAQSVVRDAVWSLSRHSAGLCVRFVTDAPSIHARWTLTSDRLAMVHMPATGVSGLDLYAKTDGGWRWLAVGRPTQVANSMQLVSGIPAEPREYLLYLPLYNGVKSLEIGIPGGRTLSQPAARAPEQAKPIVFYGTSITQGGCASRTGMVHTAILGRRLNRPVINLGFSGNGRMELEVAELLAELDPAVYVIDCLPNITADDVTQRTEPLVRVLRKARPQTPIVLVEDRNYTDGFLVTSRRTRNETSQAALKAVYAKLQAQGVANLYYVEGEKLLGADGDDTVDGSHPTDLGFLRQADALQPVLEDALRRNSKR
jgi:lysophospholipase L1-like esterase